jgi:hypothetical protein
MLEIWKWHRFFFEVAGMIAGKNKARVCSSNGGWSVTPITFIGLKL